jgi:hypothetical protein
MKSREEIHKILMALVFLGGVEKEDRDKDWFWEALEPPANEGFLIDGKVVA